MIAWDAERSRLAADTRLGREWIDSMLFGTAASCFYSSIGEGLLHSALALIAQESVQRWQGRLGPLTAGPKSVGRSLILGIKNDWTYLSSITKLLLDEISFSRAVSELDAKKSNSVSTGMPDEPVEQASMDGADDETPTQPIPPAQDEEVEG